MRIVQKDTTKQICVVDREHETVSAAGTAQRRLTFIIHPHRPLCASQSKKTPPTGRLCRPGTIECQRRSADSDPCSDGSGPADKAPFSCAKLRPLSISICRDNKHGVKAADANVNTGEQTRGPSACFHMPCPKYRQALPQITCMEHVRTSKKTPQILPAKL